MLRIIAAVSSNGVIGKNNKIPWHCPADLKFFKKMTSNSTVVMGRNTFNSLPSPLPNRRNVIITSSPITNMECYSSIQNFLDYSPKEDIWFIGGAVIYQEALNYVEEIYLTIIPEIIEPTNSVKFPWINPTQFKVTHNTNLNNSICVVIYEKYNI